MRAPALITVAAITAIAVGALLLTQLPEPLPKKAAETVIAPPAPPPASEAASAASVAASPPAEPVAPLPAVEAPPAETKAETASATQDEEVAAAESAGDANDSTEVATDETGDEDEESDQPAGAIDVGRAADLVADWMAKQDAAATDESNIPQSVQALRTFDHEETDSTWAEPTTQQIEDTLAKWLDALPDEVRAHIEILHVECRQTYCQILAADNQLDMQNERAQASQEWQQAIATLPQQPWWHELGFVDLTTAVDSEEESGYILYQTYLRREVKPAG